MVEESVHPVPEHIAIIMDGNGRWAKKRGLPRTAGHKAGAETFRRIADYCRSIGVKYLTVYAFSTENWKRSEEEVSGIMRLLGAYLREALREMEKQQVRVCFFGDLSRLSPELRRLCETTQSQSAKYTTQVNICLNYGGRAELVTAAKAFAIDSAYDPLYGARPLRRFLQHTVETLVSRRIIADQVAPGQTLTVDCVDGELTVK